MHQFTRRNFLKAAGVATVAAGAFGMAGCSGSASEGSEAAAEAIQISEEKETLVVCTNLKDTKISPIAIALSKDYYGEENLEVKQESFANGFQVVMPALSGGDIDVVPFGSIPSCTYIAQGDDLVIFGGTVLDGSECITLAENKDAYKAPEDFKGKKIGCFPMETGHMAIKSWLSQNGLNVNGTLADGADVEFILMGGSQAQCEGVKKGEIDLTFVNSGYGFVAIQDPALAVAFRPNELIGHDFPCCRQTTNRTAFEEKKSALVKFEIANLRALCDLNLNKDETIDMVCETSGQSEEYVEATIYSTDTYTAAMKFSMDPMIDDVKRFYEDMVDNGSLENSDKEVILSHMDNTIYLTALNTLIERGENVDFYKGLMTEFEAHNTLEL